MIEVWDTSDKSMPMLLWVDESTVREHARSDEAMAWSIGFSQAGVWFTVLEHVVRTNIRDWYHDNMGDPGMMMVADGYVADVIDKQFVQLTFSREFTLAQYLMFQKMWPDAVKAWKKHVEKMR